MSVLGLVSKDCELRLISACSYSYATVSNEDRFEKKNCTLLLYQAVMCITVLACWNRICRAKSLQTGYYKTWHSTFRSHWLHLVKNNSWRRQMTNEILKKMKVLVTDCRFACLLVLNWSITSFWIFKFAQRHHQFHAVRSQTTGHSVIRHVIA